MIWAALASAIAIALGAGKKGSLLETWLDQWRKHLRKHVDEPERREAAQAIVDVETERVQDYFETVEGQLLELYAVHRDYEATVADYEPSIDAIVDALGELQGAQVAATIEMRQTLSPQQWESIQADVDRQLDKYWARRSKRDEDR